MINQRKRRFLQASAAAAIMAAFPRYAQAVDYVKRDPRQRERKKPGQKGARKKFAWVKR